mmetsp:Transcript_4852/g.10709  ORF Transcript_4852/g.10709 Transcript_4852/m.10709 type:complete len:100 (-) Transcript_4852:100-399(-)
MKAASILSPFETGFDATTKVMCKVQRSVVWLSDSRKLTLETVAAVMQKCQTKIMRRRTLKKYYFYRSFGPSFITIVKYIYCFDIGYFLRFYSNFINNLI